MEADCLREAIDSYTNSIACSESLQIQSERFRLLHTKELSEVQKLPDEVLRQFASAVGAGGMILELSQRQTYECDGLTAIRTVPSAVLLPRTREEVQAIVRVCAEHRIPFVARGAGTGLSGGALPAAGGIVLSFARMNRILAVDLANQRVTVEPGVINTHVTQRVAGAGYFYAPDPSSHDRWECCGECGGGALPEVWLHDDACAGAGSGAADG